MFIKPDDQLILNVPKPAGYACTVSNMEADGKKSRNARSLFCHYILLILLILGAFILTPGIAIANDSVSLTLTANADPIEDGSRLEFTATVANSSGIIVTNAVSLRRLIFNWL